MTALSALANLLRQVLKDRAASSNAPLSGASESSHDQNRREAHVSIDVSAAVSQHEGTPKVARSSRTTTADRAVRRRTAERFGGAPAWQELPVETQAALINLMARLILGHVQGSRTGSATEAVHGSLTRSAPITWSARRCSMCDNPRPIRFCTTARAARCNTPCETG